MKSARLFLNVLILAVTLCVGGVALAGEMGTAFTYQGRLLDANAAADDVYDFRFKLYDDSDIVIGQQIGSVIDKRDINILDGYFTVELDFGISVFGGNAVWLEIGVLRQSIEYDPFAFMPLSPLQEIAPTPYALYAKNAGTDNDWMVSGNDIYSINSGNVGIGTSTPSYRLHAVDTTPGSDAPAIYGEHAVTDYYGVGVKGVGLYKGVEGSVSATGSSTYFGVAGSASTISNQGTAYGVFGSGNGADSNYGVYGVNSTSGNYGYLGNNKYGAYGANTSGNYGCLGEINYGVHGVGLSSDDYGVYGKNNYGYNNGYLGGYDYGVYGENKNSSGFTYSYGYLGGPYGAYAQYQQDFYSVPKIGYIGSANYGVYGEYSSYSYGYLGSNSYGVYGRNDLIGGQAVYGRNDGAKTTGYLGGTYGVFGSNSNATTAGYLGGIYGVYGQGGVYQGASTFAGYFQGDVYVYGYLTAADIYDRTPYPKDLMTAYQAVMSMERLGDGQYMENDKEMQLDHSTLSDFIRGEDGHRNLSATVSCQNEVLKDLIRKQDQLGKDSEVIELLKQQVEVLQKDKENIKLLEVENESLKQRLEAQEKSLQQLQAVIMKGAM